MSTDIRRASKELVADLQGVKAPLDAARSELYARAKEVNKRIQKIRDEELAPLAEQIAEANAKIKPIDELIASAHAIRDMKGKLGEENLERVRQEIEELS